MDIIYNIFKYGVVVAGGCSLVSLLAFLLFRKSNVKSVVGVCIRVFLTAVISCLLGMALAALGWASSGWAVFGCILLGTLKIVLYARLHDLLIIHDKYNGFAYHATMFVGLFGAAFWHLGILLPVVRGFLTNISDGFCVLFLWAMFFLWAFLMTRDTGSASQNIKEVSEFEEDDTAMIEMDEQAQVEEMARICTDKCRECHNVECRNSAKSQYCICATLYGAGYRKVQAETTNE